jgi:hypothetical protein
MKPRNINETSEINEANKTPVKNESNETNNP